METLNRVMMKTSDIEFMQSVLSQPSCLSELAKAFAQRQTMKATFEIIRQDQGYSFRLRYNEKTLLHSSVHYYPDIDSIIRLTRRLSHCSLQGLCFSTHIALSGVYYFQLTDSRTGQVLAKCGSFDSKEAVDSTVSRVKRLMPRAELVFL